MFDEQGKSLILQLIEAAPTPKVPRNLNSPNLNFLDVDNEELARQLTLIDFEIFRTIKVGNARYKLTNYLSAHRTIASILEQTRYSLWLGS